MANVTINLHEGAQQRVKPSPRSKGESAAGELPAAGQPASGQPASGQPASPSVAQWHRRVAPPAVAHERHLPVDESLEPLLFGGALTLGSTVGVAGCGAVTLAVALLARASREGAWTAAIGFGGAGRGGRGDRQGGALGVRALAERGVSLERWVHVDAAGRCSASVLGAAISGFDVVLLGPDALGRGDLTGSVERQLRARLRQHGTVLMSVSSPSTPSTATGAAAGVPLDVTITVERTKWEGLADGYGRLLARQADVRVEGRAAAAKRRRLLMWLPGPEGQVGRVRADA